MLVGIDGFCFHRYFGLSYPDLEPEPDTRLTAAAVIDVCAELEADGVAIEDFMLPDDRDLALREARALKQQAADAGLTLMWSWGHPDGLGSGRDRAALDDLLAHVELAEAAGASVMRICAGGRNTRPRRFAQQRDLLLPMLAFAAEQAWAAGVQLAVENHGDLLAAELAGIVGAIGHPGLGVCLDTGNNLRMLEDPAEAIRVLAPYAKAVHLKDIAAHQGDPKTFTFWPSVPVGKGLIDVPEALWNLAEAGFDGMLAIELDYLHPNWNLDERAALAESLAYVRPLVADLDDSGELDQSGQSDE